MASSVQSDTGIDIERAVLRKYYTENDFFMSAEGILKALSIAVCTVSSVSFLWGGWCGRPQLAAGAGGAMFGAGALLAVLCASTALALPRHAPLTCFITDLIISTVIGVSLALIGILNYALCETRRVIDYVYGPLALINSGLVIGSAVKTYMSVAKRWDTEYGIVNEKRNSTTNELDV